LYFIVSASLRLLLIVLIGAAFFFSFFGTFIGAAHNGFSGLK
jgi:hypothetical protein